MRVCDNHTLAHSLKSQAGMGLESDCLLGHLDRFLRISCRFRSRCEIEESEGVVEKGECGDDAVGMLERDLIFCL